MERTLVIVKPDAMQRGLASEVLARIERRGLRFIGMKLMSIDRALAERHYAVHREKPFYNDLVEYITSGPVIVAVVEGPSAVAIVRSIVGATNPVEASPGTIRGDYGVTIGRNLVHASDSVENGVGEVDLFFNDAELVPFDRSVDGWIFEE